MSFADTIFPWLLKLRRADGSLADGQCDAAGNLKVAVATATDVASMWVDPEAGAPLTPDLRLAVPESELEFRQLSFVFGIESLPVVL